jgi:hypothetical protein
MSGTDGAVAHALDGFKLVRLSDVENELVSRLASASTPDAPASRACALNLIVCIEDAGDAGVVSALIDRVAASHPMRVIGMILDPHVPATEVRAWLKLDCNGPSTERLCSEEIALVASPDSTARLASAVRGLLSPDLPIVLWWRGEAPFLARLFKGLAPLADKIVVDSIRFGDGPAALDTLHRLCDYRDGQVAVADMNWLRTTSWRVAVSACFDDPAVRQLLPEIDRSEIDVSIGPRGKAAPPSARSLLLAAWLISRLPSMAGHGEINGRRSDWAASGSILSLRLRSTSSRAGVALDWRGADEAIVASALDRDGNAIRRWRFTPDSEDESQLLYRCIDSMSRDMLLDAALRVD